MVQGPPRLAAAGRRRRSARAQRRAALAQARKEIEDGILDRLSEEAAKVDPAESTVVALDWLNGRRTPFADQTLKGAIVGLTLGTTAPKVFRALVEATAFGSRAIVEQFRKEGIPINAVIAQGGIARKSPFVMQVTADILGMPIRVVASDQACALGAGMLAAVAGGVYPTVAGAQKKMGSGFDKTFKPDGRNARRCTRGCTQRYIALGGSLEGFLSSAMKREREGRRLQQLREAGLQGEHAARGARSGGRPRSETSPASIGSSGLIAIKPSGVEYADLSPANMVVLDLEGKKVEGDLNPSSDTKTHVRLYREFPDIGGVVHTHSRHATAWAQARRALPCFGTTHADYFHGDVPCTAVISDGQIGLDYEEETAVQILDAFSECRLPRHPRGARGVPRAVHLGQGCRRGGLPRLHPRVRGGNGGAGRHGSIPRIKGVKQTLLDKHYLRKHGKDAYYGQGHGHG